MQLKLLTTTKTQTKLKHRNTVYTATVIDKINTSMLFTKIIDVVWPYFAHAPSQRELGSSSITARAC